MVNVICSTGFWVRYRTVVRACPALLIRGILQNTEGVINVIADRAEPLGVQVRSTSRDFR